MSERPESQREVAESEPPSSTARVDRVLVSRGLARSRAIARTYVQEGRVWLAGRQVRKPAEPVVADQPLEVTGETEPWVGRAAYKLLTALDGFEPTGLRVVDRRCLDVGASTGGFTQVLIARGAAEVTALDVGHDQLAASVRDHPRVWERSGTSIRDVGPTDLGGVFDVIVGDLSFISLRLVIAQIAPLLAPNGDAVLLVKPQFEVGRAALGKTGVVHSVQQRVEAVRGVLATGQEFGLHPFGLLPSSIAGSTGNREYLLWLAPRTEGMMSAMDVTEALDRAVR